MSELQHNPFILTAAELHDSPPDSMLSVQALNLDTGAITTHDFAKLSDPALNWQAEWFRHSPEGWQPAELTSGRDFAIARGVGLTATSFTLSRELPADEDPAQPTPEQRDMRELAAELQAGTVVSNPNDRTGTLFWRLPDDQFLGQVLDFSLATPDAVSSDMETYLRLFAPWDKD